MKRGFFILIYLFAGLIHDSAALTIRPDSAAVENRDTTALSDSLKVKTYRYSLPRMVYEQLLVGNSNHHDFIDHLNLLGQYSGKTIATINMKALDVFGPTFQDTAATVNTWLGSFANKIHTKTNVNIIRKNVLFTPGDTLDIDKVLDNERIIRLLPFIKDVRFSVSPNEADTSQIDLTVLTKDVFSFGAGSHLEGTKSASLEIYNQNIWGAGHQFLVRTVGHIDREPYIGFEGFYTINNIKGNFINLRTGYSNTYKRNGVIFDFEKEFLLSSTQWGGGLTYGYFDKSDRLYDDNPIMVDVPLNYRVWDWWSGYSFQLNRNQPAKNFQFVLSGRFRSLNYFERPEPGEDQNQFFSDSRLYMLGLSFSKRNYIRDHHIYGYGITEDIPKGFLHELVVGYEDHELLNRWYTHLYFSSGNFIRYRPSYLFASIGLGAFFTVRQEIEQGLLEFNLNYISRIFRVGNQDARHFARLRYLYGINRFDQENLFLKNGYGIRGLYSDETVGKQRLTLDLELVVFQKRDLLKFNFAFFGFTDLGIIGSANKFIFDENYYAGIGAGVRFRNESLVFNTIQLRFVYYPGHPADAGAWSFGLSEMRRAEYYSFQARKPEPLPYR
ncbi:hypothetical protein [Gaoshiqia sp. Z1-71]|uniref:hypothetical protein n=1 Tax=Gaoshiqia hydrogeniformans TaxID=3290090 RepID=UPI003BF79A5C